MFKKAYFVILSIICERLDHAIQPELSNVQVAIKTLNLPSPPAPNPGPNPPSLHSTNETALQRFPFPSLPLSLPLCTAEQRCRRG